MKKITGLLFALIVLFGAMAADGRSSISLQDRIAFQKAIEEVYWRHTIWPNQQPKPSLDAILSKSALRHKTEEYVRKSNALEEHWHHTITAGELQSEIDRMARATQNPEFLNELWTALHNDAYVIAECVARPILVERATSQIPGFQKRWRNLRSRETTLLEAPNHRYTLPKIGASNSPVRTQSTDLWFHLWPTSGSPSARYGHMAVWTGTLMIIWGGEDEAGTFDDGGRYDPATDSWSAFSLGLYKTYGSAVWTGSKMIVWGGTAQINGAPTNTGALYDPIANQWTNTTVTGAPSARYNHTAVWTGKEMIVWGGFGTMNLNTGGRYNPSTNVWTATATTGATARNNHTAVWTGKQMIVWGGFAAGAVTNTGGIYNPQTDSWSATATLLAPSPRYGNSAIWTGNTMIVWGGDDNNGTTLNTGGQYDPVANRWMRPPTLTGAPSTRRFPSAVWTGSEMIIWGGNDFNNSFDTHGGRYNPTANTWTATTTTNCPVGRGGQTAVWTGNQMIIWGGFHPLFGALDTGGRYYPYFYF